MVSYDIFNLALNYDDTEIREEEVKQQEREKKEISSSITKYRECLGSKKKLSITFSSISNKGSLYMFDSGIKIVLTAKSMSDADAAVVEAGRVERTKLIGKEINVIVIGIREEEGEPPCVFVADSEKAQVGSRKHEARELLNKMIKEHDRTRIPARVIKVHKNSGHILLDIGGCGIKGVCETKDWSTGYVDEVMVDAIRPGSICSVSVEGWYRNGNNSPIGQGAIQCSRKVGNPYAGLTEKYPVGTTVAARVTVCYPKEGYAFLAINGFDDVQLFCFLPWLRNNGWKNKSNVNKIISGCLYSVVISSVDEKKQRFRGRILGLINDNVDEEIRKMATSLEDNIHGAASCAENSDKEEEAS